MKKTISTLILVSQSMSLSLTTDPIIGDIRLFCGLQEDCVEEQVYSFDAIVEYVDNYGEDDNTFTRCLVFYPNMTGMHDCIASDIDVEVYIDE